MYLHIKTSAPKIDVIAYNGKFCDPMGYGWRVIDFRK